MEVFQISDAHRMYSVNHEKSQQTNTRVLFSKTSSSWASAELNWCDDVYHVFVNSKTGCSGRLQMVATMTGSGFYHISVVLWTAHSRGSGLTERQHCSNSQIKKRLAPHYNTARSSEWHDIKLSCSSQIVYCCLWWGTKEYSVLKTGSQHSYYEITDSHVMKTHRGGHLEITWLTLSW